MKEIAKILLFNKNNDTKWDERLDLETCAICENSCMLGLVKLSNRKTNTKKIIEMVYKRMSIKHDIKIKLYIDYRLLDRLVHLDNYPFIIREEQYLKNMKDFSIVYNLKMVFNGKIPKRKSYPLIVPKFKDEMLDKQESDKLKRISSKVAGHGL